MNESIPYLISGGALLLAIANALYTRRKDTKGDWEEQIEKLSVKLETVGNRLIVVETQVSIFFRGASLSVAQALHSPHTAELDELLEKFQHGTLNDEHDVRRLRQLLRKVANNPDESDFRKKLASDALTLIRVNEIGGRLLQSMEQSDEEFSVHVHDLSRRLEH